MATLGFIGTGNMGGALARAACKSIPSDQVFLANRTAEKAGLWRKNWIAGLRTTRPLRRAPTLSSWE